MSPARHEGAYTIDVALDYRIEQPTSILLAIEALEDGEQTLAGEELSINGAVQAPSPRSSAPARYRWIEAAAGDLSIRYRAEARVARDLAELNTLPLTPYAALPPEVAPWLFASRHCDPTRFERILADEMNLPAGWVADGSTIALIRDWIKGHLSYEPVSTAETTATVLSDQSRQFSVCRSEGRASPHQAASDCHSARAAEGVVRPIATILRLPQ
jgi:hypothetical protein